MESLQYLVGMTDASKHMWTCVALISAGMFMAGYHLRGALPWWQQWWSAQDEDEDK